MNLGRLIEHPDQVTIGPGINVNLEWNERTGWIFIVAMRLTPNGLAKASRNCYEHYRGVLRDLAPGDPFRDQVIRSLEDLKKNRVVQKVTANLRKGF